MRRERLVFITLSFVARHQRACELRHSQQRRKTLGVDLGDGSVDREVRYDIAPAGNAVHLFAGCSTYNEPAMIELREDVVGRFRADGPHLQEKVDVTGRPIMM